MEQVMMYKATDGTIFDAEEDCLKHERELKEKEEKIYMFYRDKDGKYGKFNVPDMTEKERRFLHDRATYIYFPNTKAADTFNQSFKWTTGYAGDTLYTINGNHCWVCSTGLKRTIENLRDSLNLYEEFDCMATYYCAKS